MTDIFLDRQHHCFLANLSIVHHCLNCEQLWGQAVHLHAESIMAASSSHGPGDGSPQAHRREDDDDQVVVTADWFAPVNPSDQVVVTADWFAPVSPEISSDKAPWDLEAALDSAIDIDAAEWRGHPAAAAVAPASSKPRTWCKWKRDNAMAIEAMESALHSDDDASPRSSKRAKRDQENMAVIVVPGEEMDDFAEFFSSPRVLPHIKAAGFRGRLAMDIRTNNDFNTFNARATALHALKHPKVRFVMLSPPCTMFSALQRCFKNFEKMNKKKVQTRMDEAIFFLNLTALIAETQMAMGNYFCIEHPQTASSWKHDSWQKLAQIPQCQITDFDQCTVGLRCPESGLPIKKRTRLLSNAPQVRQMFQGRQCSCTGPHKQIEGSACGMKLSEHCQTYPFEFCQLLCQAVIATIS